VTSRDEFLKKKEELGWEFLMWTLFVMVDGDFLSKERRGEDRVGT